MECKKCKDEGFYYTKIEGVKVIQICNCKAGLTKVGMYTTNVGNLSFTYFKGV